MSLSRIDTYSLLNSYFENCAERVSALMMALEICADLKKFSDALEQKARGEGSVGHTRCACARGSACGRQICLNGVE